ncbi:ankyrin [Melanomma pulvis-pyrius CBS 109.77]|uniref:Ankyrin n=1 Tax=Melanomma pulvis-pyrius CBS 109.77 TaxID=1314802 RepID=A0A6A6XRM1_9PLEO|nr:ankyrin [Melanomma pulvis-pyrius CBS 109.77]
MTTAILSGNRRVVDVFLDLGASIEDHQPGSYGSASPLFAAVYMRDLSIARTLLRHGTDPSDNRAIFQAVLYQDVDLIILILEAFGHRYPHGKKLFGAEALDEAVKMENIYLLKLLAKQASANCLVKKTDTEWHTKSSLTHELNGIVEIKEADEDPDGNKVVGKKRTRTALLQAIATRELPKVEELVKLGARVDLPAKMNIKRTPLQFAAELGAEDIVRFLLINGASPNEPPAVGYGGSALQLAAAEGYLGIVSFLLSIGADINAPPCFFNGRTAFEGASENGRIDMMTFLVEHGADILAEDGRQYKRAVKFAEGKGHGAAKDMAVRLYATACMNVGRSVVPVLDDVIMG